VTTKPSDATEPKILASGRVAFQHKDYTYYWLSRTLGVFAVDLMIATLSWQLWILTKSPIVLGLIGGLSVAPFLVLFPISGMAADRFERKHILTLCGVLQSLCAFAFLYLTVTGNVDEYRMLAIVIVLGLSRTFLAPAQQSIVPVLVPKEHFANAIAWTSTGFQAARIAGPGLSGFFIAFSGEQLAYSAVLFALIISTIFTLFIRGSTRVIARDPLNFETVFAGLKFIRHHQVVLGAIALDLFAVLLGGAVALLPAVATELLGVGPEGYGILRTAHMVGAMSGAIYFTQRPISRYAGKKMFIGVGVFGLGIVALGFATTFWVAIAALLVLGAGDAVSVFVRGNLIQIITPDNMRGRVASVNSVFISASNELGELESGLTMALFGLVPAIILGGAGTIIIAIAFARVFPQLWGVDSLVPDELVRKYQ
jgi:MFS family permease